MLRASVFILLLASFALHGFAQHEESSDGQPEGTRLNWANLPADIDPARVIDLALEQGYQANSLNPAKVVDDATFARRLYLDLLGRVPRNSELDMFLGKPESNKRRLLIDALLASDEHSKHFAEVFDAIFIGRTNLEQVKRRTDVGWMNYLERSIRENRPWNKVAKEIVLARPSTDEEKGATWYLYSRKDKPQDIAEAVSRDIFGVRIDCAQCHDHPLADEIKQKHYWGLVAFFNRSKNVDTSNGPRLAESAIGGFSDFANLEGSSSPNELRYLGDRFVEEPRPGKDVKEEDKDELYVAVDGMDPRVPKFSRREQFVDKVVADHPLLAKSMVNRMWGWMMGRGLVHPVDALDSFHPASHPELLDWLAKDFQNSGYDVRRLLRNLATSNAYQLGGDASSLSDPKWFSSSLPKPLTAEILLRSMVVVLEPVHEDRWTSFELKVAMANLFPDVLAEESMSNVAQGLLLSNGSAMNELVSMKDSRLLQRVRDLNDDRLGIEMLFRSILGRTVLEEELVYCLEYFESHEKNPERAITDLAWALLTSTEFRFNH